MIPSASNGISMTPFRPRNQDPGKGPNQQVRPEWNRDQIDIEVAARPRLQRDEIRDRKAQDQTADRGDDRQHDRSQDDVNVDRIEYQIVHEIVFERDLDIGIGGKVEVETAVGIGFKKRDDRHQRDRHQHEDPDDDVRWCEAEQGPRQPVSRRCDHRSRTRNVSASIPRKTRSFTEKRSVPSFRLRSWARIRISAPISTLYAVSPPK